MSLLDVQPDPSFHPDAAWGSREWVAMRLGRTSGWFRNNKIALEAEGFPAPDRVTKLYLKADVDAWTKSRRTIPDAADTAFSTQPREKIDAF